MNETKITPGELYSTIEALKARLEWIEDFPNEAPQEEEPLCRGALQKLESLHFKITGGEN